LKDWREWCELGNKDEAGELVIEVRNTSFTGDSGCEVHWTLSLSKDVNLSINQAAGNVSGSGKIEKLSLELAAGQLTWSEMNMFLSVKLAAGNVDLTATGWPNKGSSKISVATGNISIKSPKGSSVSTEISKAMGVSSNDFPVGKKDHSLKIELALGKANHQSY
jgi:hypothetical protein